jgi:ecotin
MIAMKSVALSFALSLIACFSMVRFPSDQLKAFPKAAEGTKRFVIQLPEQENETDFRVELQVGKMVETDSANRYFFSGKIEEETIIGWGFPKYIVRELGPMAGTLIGVDPSVPKVTRWITLGGEPKLWRYNSKIPLVIYVPKEAEVRFRIWRSDAEASIADEG